MRVERHQGSISGTEGVAYYENYIDDTGKVVEAVEYDKAGNILLRAYAGPDEGVSPPAKPAS